MFKILQIAAVIAIGAPFQTQGDEPKPLTVCSLANLVQNLGSLDPLMRKNAVAEATRQLDFYGVPIFGGGNSLALRPSAKLKTIQQKAHSYLPKILDLVEHHDKDVASTALGLLTIFVPEDGSRLVGDRLKGFLRDKRQQSETRLEAALTLLFVTPERESVMPFVLPTLMATYSPSLRMTKAESQFMRDLEPTTISLTVPALVMPLLASGHTESEVPHLVWVAASERRPRAHRALSLGVLAELGPDAVAALPLLRELVMNEDVMIRNFAANAVLCIERQSTAIDNLADRMELTGEDRKEFSDAGWAYLNELESERKVMREAIADDVTVANDIANMLHYRSGFYRRMAIRLLADAGPAAITAVPRLRETAQHDPDARTRTMASAALRKISP